MTRKRFPVFSFSLSAKNYKFVKTYPTVLTIAGSDSGGGAGIQADLKTMSALGVFGTSAITSITSQNTTGVRSIQAITPDIVRDQIDAVCEDFHVNVFKIGMLYAPSIVKAVRDAIDKYQPKAVILDPVMIATSGSLLIEEDTIDAIKTELFPRCTILTPNLDEAEFLTKITIRDVFAMEKAGRELLNMNCKNVLMKGGHLGGPRMIDLLLSKERNTIIPFEKERIETENTHGTGCTYASAIASHIALGFDLQEAVRLSKEYITSALAAAADVKMGHGSGPLNHFFNPKKLKALEI